MLNKHTIWKQVLEVETSDPTAKVGFEREIERWYKDNLLPELEALFDRSAGPNTLLRTEKIEILVTLPLTHNWKEKLCDNVITEVNRHLQNIAPLQLSTPDGMENAFGINHPVLVDSRTPPAIAYWQERLQSEKKGPVLPSDASSVFLHFLETGTLPWFGKQWSNTDLAIQVQEQAARNPGFIQKLRSLLSVQPKALMRCLHQFGEGLLKELFGQTEAYKKMAAWKFILVSAGAQREELFWKWYLQEGKSDKPLLSLLTSLPEGYIERWWTEDASSGQQGKMWKALELGSPAPGIPKNIRVIMDAIGDHSRQGQAQKPILQKARSVKEEIQEEGIYVDNAGLVILHPFLNPLFNALNYWDGKGFCSEQSQQRAVLMTQYLLAPGEEFPEHQLLLNKVLCGYDLEEPLPARLETTEEEQQQADALLEAVLNYWKLNGNQVCTTVDNLRASFLHRPGKLIRKPGEWLLMVEKRTYDIVLKGLPWSIGMIKHPWMQDMLKVQWD
jgi:hypothetical protein